MQRGTERTGVVGRLWQTPHPDPLPRGEGTLVVDLLSGGDFCCEVGDEAGAEFG